MPPSNIVPLLGVRRFTAVSFAASSRGKEFQTADRRRVADSRTSVANCISCAAPVGTIGTLLTRIRHRPTGATVLPPNRCGPAPSVQRSPIVAGACDARPAVNEWSCARVRRSPGRSQHDRVHPVRRIASLHAPGCRHPRCPPSGQWLSDDFRRFSQRDRPFVFDPRARYCEGLRLAVMWSVSCPPRPSSRGSTTVSGAP